MTLSDIFAKPINRRIEGVIKADDEASLRLEVEEYVLTHEVARRLEAFLAAYTHYEGGNGAWISGFFGSGKSHLLKMLALLLEKREVEGASVVDLFLAKCEENEILRGDLKRAVAIPARSILFNIDQKADVISKTQVDALLGVFVKVFDEMCGYYGKQGYIAQFERDLDGRGLYQAFKQTYRQLSGLEWESGREQALLETPHITAAYAQVTGQPHASNILDKYRADYRMSIEDFANQVQAYIARQEPSFRLNFFVDEVGQYIAGNVKLMTNLQTIAESLATKSRGRAWLIVTAQEELETVIGEMTPEQGNDFTKISARFANRMKLTSTDVAEVIRRRLLQKNAAGVEALADVYAAQHNNFRTLFDFADGGRTYRNFRDHDDFIHSYPFIPYQFELFQSAIEGLSGHNAFEGRHRSVGERSMLGVFQQVAVQIAGSEVGQLASFDQMFEGIRTALKAQTQRSILAAERQLDNPLAIRVLKALFLVKYVKEFRATQRNITVLMLDRFDIDLPAFRKQIESALDLLEQQTYIQRNGEDYEYLTDEEKDVEQEIKNTEVDVALVAEELGKIIFDQVLKDRKIRYDEHGQDYPFGRRVDGMLLGREYELAIHVISPFYEHAGNDAVLRAHSMGRDELVVILPPSDRLARDLLMVKRTEKYIRQNSTTAQRDAVTRILSDKQVQNQQRLAAVRTLAEEMLGQARMVVNGQDVGTMGGEPRTRLINAFYELLIRTYPNLRMLRGVVYAENDIAACLNPAATLLGGEAATFSEAEQEMLAFIQGNNRSGIRTTLQLLLNRFERKPYGWPLAAIQCTLARLCGRGKVEVRRDGVLLEDHELERGLRNTQGYANLVLEPQIDFTPTQVRRLRDFYAEFFDGPPAANEAKSLGQETAARLRALADEIAALQRQTDDYPFLAALAGPAAQVRAVTDKPYSFYLTDLGSHEDALLEAKEQALDPIRQFMGGAQKGIYDQARQYMEAQESNFAYVAGDEASQLRMLLADPACHTGNRMAQMKQLLEGLQARVAEQLQHERLHAAAAVEERWQRLANTSEFEALTTAQRDDLRRPFDALKDRLERQSLIAVLRDTLRQFDLNGYTQQLRCMTVWAEAAARGGTTFSPTEAGAATAAEPHLEYVTRESLRIRFGKAWLADESDVDLFLAALKEALIQAIRDGKRIQL